jgi:hypothetical protein
VKQIILAAITALCAAGCCGPSPAGPVMSKSDKPIIASYSVSLDGPAQVTPGQAFDLTATIMDSPERTAAPPIRAQINIPPGAKLEAGDADTSVPAAKTSVVKYKVSVPDNNYYRFAIVATRAGELNKAAFDVGTPPAMKPAVGGKTLETKDGKKVMGD